MNSVIKSAKTVDEAIELALIDLGLTRDSVEIEVLEEAKSGFLGIFGSQDAIVKVTEKIEFKIDINDIYGEKEAEEAKKAKEKEEALLAEKKAEEEKIRKQKEAQEREKARKEAEDKKAIEEKKMAEKREAEEQEKLAEKAPTSDDTIETVSEDVFEQESSNEKKSSEQLLEDVKTNLEDILKSMHIEASVEAENDNGVFSYNLVDISEEDTGIIIGRKGETLDSLQYILSLMANKNSTDYNRVSLNVANYRTRRKEAIENNAKKLAFKVIKSKKPMSLEPMNSYERRIVHYALQNYKEVETISQGNFPNRKVVIKYKG